VDLWLTEEMLESLDQWAREIERSRAWLIRYLLERGLTEERVARGMRAEGD
jgi:metal-responsive CopG/Arc/MetJ family transcriptional regulator